MTALHKSFGSFEIKAVDEEKRTFKGVASTPNQDRVKDIMVPEGAEYQIPMPLLFHHEMKKPIGQVLSAKVTEEGIEVEIQIPEIKEVGTLKDRVDEAYQSLKYNLVKGLSVGFLPDWSEAEYLKNGGIRFNKWEWYELSLVTIPCNRDSGTDFKKAFEEHKAALGEKPQTVPDGASSEQKHVVVKLDSPTKGWSDSMKEYLAKLLKALAEKNTAMQAALSKSAQAGTTPDEATEAEIQAIEKEIAAIKVNIERTEKQIAEIEKAAKTATPVAGETPGQAVASAEGNPNPSNPAPKVETIPTLEKGVGYAMAVKATALAGKSIAKGIQADALSILKHWGAPKEVQDIIIAKAAVGTTTDADFAAALVNQQVLTNEFIELLRPKTLVGRLVGFRKVPFNVKIPLQTGASTVSWVGEGQNKPATNPKFSTVTLGKHKVAGIVVMTDELIADSSPSAPVLVRDDLLASMAQHADTAFIDPTKDAVDGVSPASITNGLVADDAFNAAGTTAAQYEADFLKAIKRFLGANLTLEGAYWLMSETKAIELALLRDALGGSYFKGMEMGSAANYLLNIRVETSENVGSQIVLMKPSEILLADEGGVDIAMSSEATIQIGVDTQVPPQPILVNLFQQNMTAVRAEQFKTWKKARNLGVVRIIYS